MCCVFRYSMEYRASCDDSSVVQIKKKVGSVSCSECLQLVTDITFINIIVLVLGLYLCDSNRHTIFLFIYITSFNIRIDFILTPLQINHLYFQQMSHNSTTPSYPTLYSIKFHLLSTHKFPNPFPSHTLSNPLKTICCQHTKPTLPSLPNLYPITLTQSAVNTQIPQSLPFPPSIQSP